MSVDRANVVRHQPHWSVLMVAVMLVVLVGCKRDKPQTPAAPKESAQKESAQKVEEKGTAPAVAEAEKAAPAAAEAPEDGDVQAEEDVAPAVPVVKTKAPVPITDATSDADPTPTTAPQGEYVTGTDKKRLAGLFVDMWCAQGRGATQEELLKIYHGYDYPPLSRWHDYWSATMVDRSWVRDTVARARSRCPDVAKMQKNPAKLAVPAAPVEAASPEAAK